MKKKKKQETAETHPDLKGLDIRVNAFGEIISNISVDKLNDFLNKNVVDKKLDEDAWEEKKKKVASKSTPERKHKKKKGN